MIKPLTIPPKKLAQSIISTDSTFILNNILGWDGVDLTTADFGSTCYAVFKNSTNTAIEIIEIDVTTIASASITMLTRGMAFDGTLTSVPANKLDWSANDTSVMLGTDAPQLWEALKDYIDAIAIAGAPNATLILQGLLQLATQAQVDAGTATGSTTAPLAVTPDKIRAGNYNDYVIDTGAADAYAIAPSPAITAYATGQIFTFKAVNANTSVATLNINGLGAKTLKKNVTGDLSNGDIQSGQIITVVYDGTNFQIISRLGSAIPNIKKFTTQVTKGSATTQFTITNPSGTTFRYTYTGTGTDPSDFTGYLSIGKIFSIHSTAMNAANTGLFTVTNLAATWIEVTNVSGVAEATKALTNGYFDIGMVYTPTTGTKYIIVEMVGGGADGTAGLSTTVPGTGGASGGYLRKLLSSNFSGLQAIVGPLIPAAGRAPYGVSAFGIALIANGANGTTPGTASGGDVTFSGGGPCGIVNGIASGGSAGASTPLGEGGGGGPSGNGAGQNGSGSGSGGGGGGSGSPGGTAGNGTNGQIIITEYF